VSRFQATFGALIAVQTMHSIEEYLGRLWESFPPAAFVSGLISADREIGFVVINCALVAFGVWCLLFPIRRAWPSAPPFAWFWVALETVNGIGHSAWSVRQHAYTPGAFTAPLLLGLALYLASQLARAPRRESPAA
jgi:hypothetical protein